MRPSLARMSFQPVFSFVCEIRPAQNLEQPEYTADSIYY